MLYDPKWEPKITVATVLISAKALIQQQSCWARGAWARNAMGVPVDAEDQYASSFCLHGALVRAAGSFDAPERYEALSLLKEAAGHPPGFPGSWNDHATHSEVLAAFDRAIEMANH